MIEQAVKSDMTVPHDMAHYASMGDIEEVRKLLDSGICPDSAYTNVYNRIPLMRASIRGHIGVVSLLLERGANPNTPDIKKSTALMYASTYGRVDIVKLLLENGADYTMVDMYGATAYSLSYNDRTRDVIRAHIIRPKSLY